ncbi:hypothetical protein NSA19_01890 [Actinomyces bowdenii]|uniref:hypothetical protein n=1 Tax=Actinomyces bowdenii TaxID=131109 RepID=UPI00214B0CB9|nr:hypothetical protein [Actinomyces bowdenii]MCR2051624.1 hypothetical protein [Actinomyces bowdenii]
MAGAALLAVSLTAPTAAAGTAGAIPASQTSTSQFDTLAELQQARGLSGTVRTAGDEYPGDGAGMTYTVTPTRPTDETANVAMPLADGQWAVPQGFSTAPSTQSSSAATEDLINRGQTFVDAGTQLQWDASRPTPLTGKVIHSVNTAPYAVTCSSFVGMALMGWTYDSTTYVAGENTKVGYGVDFGPDAIGSPMWQANNLASWFYANGDLWLDTEGQYQRGDVLFFSSHNPTVTPGTAEGARSTFGNVYHVAIYLGDGMLMHSTGRAAGQGVHVSKMGSSLEADLSFVARPNLGGTSSQGTASNGAAAASAVQDQQGAGQAGAPQGVTDSDSVAQDAAPSQGAEVSQGTDTGQGDDGGQAADGGRPSESQADQGQQGSDRGEQDSASTGSAFQGALPDAAPTPQNSAVAVIAASDVEGDVPHSPQPQAAAPKQDQDGGQQLPMTGASIAGAVVTTLLVAAGAAFILARRVGARRAAVSVSWTGGRWRR